MGGARGDTVIPEVECECPFHRGAEFVGRLGSSSPSALWKVIDEAYYQEPDPRYEEDAKIKGPKHHVCLKNKNVNHSYMVRCISIIGPKSPEGENNVPDGV